MSSNGLPDYDLEDLRIVSSRQELRAMSEHPIIGAAHQGTERSEGWASPPLLPTPRKKVWLHEQYISQVELSHVSCRLSARRIHYALRHTYPQGVMYQFSWFPSLDCVNSNRFTRPIN